MFPLARSANIIYRKQISLQYYSRASVNVTAPQGARKRCLRRKHSSKRSAVRMLSPHRNNNSVFSRTCAGKRHLKSRERGDRKGVNGGKREGERSEQESVVTRQNKDSRRVGGHAPPQRHLERSAATMKVGFTGRKQNKRKRILLSSRLMLSCYSYHTHRHIVTRRGRLAPSIDYRAGKGCGGL